MFHIAFYVPENDAEKVKEAMFATGAGAIGNYERCSFEYRGIGQFMPKQESRPFIGHIDILEKVNEIKIEMVCDKQFLKAAITALKSTHPYETPAYYVTEIVRIDP
jgi:hypothetical protein